MNADAAEIVIARERRNFMAESVGMKACRRSNLILVRTVVLILCAAGDLATIPAGACELVT